MDENDFESLKQKRMAALKQQQAKKQEWLANGHGRQRGCFQESINGFLIEDKMSRYEEIPEEKDFFAASKNSDRVVVHFYKDDTFR